MGAGLVDSYGDLLSALEADRQAHSLAVGRKMEAAASQVPASVWADLVAAAVLHDIGYGHPVTGFHLLDGARYLAGTGFPRRVCHLVVHRSASTLKAQERGLDSAVYADFALEDAVNLGPAHALLWWASI